MIRENAHSLYEIGSRHGCVDTVGHNHDLPEIPPLATLAVVSSESLIKESFLAALPKMRDRFEVVETYVCDRDNSVADAYEPLVVDDHFDLTGWWIAILRRRQSVEPRIVGMMLAKDEADVIPDVLAKLSTALDALYYFAGDDATAAAIEKHSRVGWARAIPDPKLPHADGLRQLLLEQARRDAITDNDLRPMWVMSVQGDEVYHDDLRRHILYAQSERATVLNAQVATFLLHESQMEGWDWTQPLETRLTHYIWDFQEHAGFVDFPWLYYVPSEHMRAHPHGIDQFGKWANEGAWPVRRHCPFRTPEQARARLQDRLKATEAHPEGWQPHYKNYEQVFVRDYAAEREVKRFSGEFPEAVRLQALYGG